MLNILNAHVLLEELLFCWDPCLGQTRLSKCRGGICHGPLALSSFSSMSKKAALGFWKIKPLPRKYQLLTWQHAKCRWPPFLQNVINTAVASGWSRLQSILRLYSHISLNKLKAPMWLFPNKKDGNLCWIATDYMNMINVNMELIYGHCCQGLHCKCNSIYWKMRPE